MMEFIIFSSGIAFLYAVDYLIDYLVFGSANGKYSKYIKTDEIKLLETKRILRELTLEQVPVTPQFKQTKATYTYQPWTTPMYNKQINHKDIYPVAVFQTQDSSAFQPLIIIVIIIIIVVFALVFYICKRHRWLRRYGKSASSELIHESLYTCEEDEQNEWADAVSYMFGDFGVDEMRTYIEKAESVTRKPVIMNLTLLKDKSLNSEENTEERKQEKKPEKEAGVYSFKTDVDIQESAGKDKLSKAGLHREFQKWQVLEEGEFQTAEFECLENADAEECKDKTIFSAEEMFRLNPSIKTTFKDDLSQYSTELDVSTLTREQIEFAEIMAMKIMKENKQRKNKRRRKKTRNPSISIHEAMCQDQE